MSSSVRDRAILAYEELAEVDQIAALRPVAAAAAARFGLEVESLELVAHAFNTTFAVAGADGARHALRVNTNSVSTPENVVAQQAWQRAIAAETDVVTSMASTSSESRARSEDSGSEGSLEYVLAATIRGARRLPRQANGRA